VLLCAIALTCAKESSLRGEQPLKTKLLAQIKVAQDAKVEILEVDGAIVIAAEGEGDENKETVKKALEKAKKESDDLDLVGFFKKVAGTDEAPDELVKAVDMLGSKKMYMKDEDEPKVPPASPVSAQNIGEDDSVVKHADGGGDEDRRRLGFCTGVYSPCMCYTYLTGNYYANYYDTYVESWLDSNFGYVTHSIYRWNGYSWTRYYYGNVSTGRWSYIYASDFFSLWQVATTNGYGDSYNWKYC